MSRDDRTRLIGHLEEKRKAKILSCFWGDRPGLVTQMADDTLGFISEILHEMGHQEEIDIFLYTRGGMTTTPLRIAHLTREFCSRLGVIIPFRAHSGGTLLSLGAEKIVMTELAELTPVDPRTANDFNPMNPLNPAIRIPISVEDVKAYLKLAEEVAQLTSETSRLDVFKSLSSQVNPVALGNVYRVYRESQLLAEGLLRLHMTTDEEKQRIPAILKALTETYTHGFPFPRKEAKKIGLKVEEPDEEEAKLIKELYKIYEQDLLLTDPFNPEALLGEQEEQTFSHETAYLESSSKTYAFMQDGVVSRSPAPVQLPVGGGGQIQIPGAEPITVKFLKQKWEEVN